MDIWTDFLRANGARLDESIVLDFGSPGKEIAAASAGVLCPLADWAAFDIVGVDAAAFLQGQLTSDVQQLSPGRAQRTAWCSAKGRMLATAVLVRTAPEQFTAILPASIAEAVRRRLAMFVLRAKVLLLPPAPEAVLCGVAGVSAEGALRAVGLDAPAPWAVGGDAGSLVVALDGGRYLVRAARERWIEWWPALCRSGIVPAGATVWRWLDIAAGVARIGPETQDRFVPQMANWELVGGVSFHKGCYPGQEIVARMQYLGRLKERLVRLDGEPATPPAPGTALFNAAFGDQAAGTIVDAVLDAGGRVAALAVAQTAAAASGALNCGGVEGPELKVRPLPYPVPEPEPPRRPGMPRPG